MKPLITLIMLPLWVSMSYAQHGKMHLYELAANADLIVQGKIKATKGRDVTVEISDVVAGTHDGGTLVFERFRNKKDRKRWGKYEEGEELLLFLKKTDDEFQIVGDGGEGEKLIVDETLMVDDRGEGLKNRFGYHPMKLAGNIYAEEVPLADAKAAVAAIRECVEVTYVEKEMNDEVILEPVAQLTCENGKLDQFRATSWVHAEVLAQAEKAAK